MKVLTTTLLCILFAYSLVAAQEAPELPKPTPEHKWLEQFVGEWESVSEASFEPGQPPMKCSATIKAKMLGGFWMVSETQSEMLGTKVEAVQTIGYDPEKQKYVGSWVDSMVNHMWKYEGSVDASGKLLTLEAEGPNFMTSGKLTMYRDAYEFKTKDHIVATSSMRGEDGKWVVFMTGHVHRKNK